MKTLLFTWMFLLSSAFLFAQPNNGKVIVTYNPTDVNGAIKASSTNVSVASMFGTQEKLREKLKEKIEKAITTPGAIALIENEQFGKDNLTAANTLTAKVTLYFSPKVAHDISTKNIIDTMNCDDAKQILQLYISKYGELSVTQSTVANNLNNGVDMNVLSVEGDKLNQTVTVYFYLYTRKPNQRISLYVKGYGFPASLTKATDTEGGQYPPKLGTLGDIQADGVVENKLSTEIKLKGSIIFSNVLSSVKQISLVSIGIVSSNFDGGENSLSGTYDIKNVNVDWK